MKILTACGIETPSVYLGDVVVQPVATVLTACGIETQGISPKVLQYKGTVPTTYSMYQ